MKTCTCRWWECVALPEDIDSSEEDSFRQQMRDLAFEVIMPQIIHFRGHYELSIFRDDVVCATSMEHLFI
jgi:hypothetical protein